MTTAAEMHITANMLMVTVSPLLFSTGGFSPVFVLTVKLTLTLLPFWTLLFLWELGLLKGLLVGYRRLNFLLFQLRTCSRCTSFSSVRFAGCVVGGAFTGVHARSTRSSEIGALLFPALKWHCKSPISKNDFPVDVWNCSMETGSASMSVRYPRRNKKVLKNCQYNN